MICGMRVGNPVGHVEPSDITVRIEPDAPGARTLSWTPERSSGVVYHVMVDGVELLVTSETTVYDFPQDARDHIRIIETSDQNAGEDVTNVVTTAQDRVKLSWSEAAGADRYEIFRKVSGGSYPTEPLAVLAAGFATYEWVDESLDDETYVYKVVAYDAAGNSADSNEPSQAISAAPDAPTDLTVTVS